MATKYGDGKGGFKSQFHHNLVTIQWTEWKEHTSDLSVVSIHFWKKKPIKLFPTRLERKTARNALAI